MPNIATTNFFHFNFFSFKDIYNLMLGPATSYTQYVESCWAAGPNSIGYGLHDFVTTHLPELPTSSSVLLGTLLFVRQSFTKSSFLVA